jgi:hypothetical protein
MGNKVEAWIERAVEEAKREDRRRR